MSNTNVQYLNGYGPPLRTTVAAVGDKYTDLHTGIVYKCMHIYKCQGHESFELEYVWEDLGTTCLPREDYEVLANQISRKANAVINQASGNTIITNDSAAEPLQSLNIYGKSEQITYSGKNLCKVTIEDQTISGVTFTVNADKSITVNGTCTNDIYFNIGVAFLEAGVEYTISGCPKLVDWSYAGFYVNATPLSGDVWNRTYENVFAMPNTQEYACTINLAKDIVFTNHIFYPMIRLATNTDTTYEPYVGGIPSPNPQYPQEIMSVGEDGSVDVDIYGGNVVDIKDGSNTSRGVIITAQNGIVSLKGTATESGYASYNIDSQTLSGTFTISSSYKGTNVRFLKEDWETAFSVTTNKTNTIQNTTITKLAFDVTAGTTYNVDGIQVSLTYGINELPYEPYNKQSISFSAPNGLPGIKVTDSSIATYTDNNGQMWVADEIDFERGKYVQRVGKYVLNGSEYFYLYNVTQGNLFRFTPDIFRVTAPNEFYNYVCNYYKDFGYANRTDKSISNTTQGSIDIINNDYYTVNDFKAELERLHSEGNPVCVYGILETPIERDLTVEELNKFKALTMNYPNTTLLSEAHMELDYVADTKLYIEKKYAELAAALV